MARIDGLLIRLSERSVFFRRKDEERWEEPGVSPSTLLRTGLVEPYRMKRMVLEAYDVLEGWFEQRSRERHE